MSAQPRRLLLVQPGRTRSGDRELSFRSPMLPLGLVTIAASARAAGHTVRVHDAVADPDPRLERLRRSLREFRPHAVGLTASTFRIGDAAVVAAAVRKWSPDVKLVLGGWHATAVPLETLEAIAALDAVVVGEGEHTLVEWLARLDSPSTWGDVDGLAFRRDGEPTRTRERAAEADLDRLPFAAYDLLPMRRYRPDHRWFPRGRMAVLATARGCPHRCTFCQNPAGTSLRERSIGSVVEELASLAAAGIHYVYFADETFTLHRKRTVALCEALAAEPALRRLRWTAMTRVDAVDSELLALMRRAGGRVLFLGVESGDEQSLAATGKRIRKEQAVRAVSLAKQAGFFVHVGQILGLPGDTPESLDRTLRFTIELDPDVCTFAPLVPFPGTEIWRRARLGEDGMRLRNADWADLRVVRGAPALDVRGLPAEEVRRWHLRAYAGFYSRPRKLLNLLTLHSPLQLGTAAWMTWMRP